MSRDREGAEPTQYTWPLKIVTVVIALGVGMISLLAAGGSVLMAVLLSSGVVCLYFGLVFRTKLDSGARRAFGPGWARIRALYERGPVVTLVTMGVLFGGAAFSAVFVSWPEDPAAAPPAPTTVSLKVRLVSAEQARLEYRVIADTTVDLEPEVVEGCLSVLSDSTDVTPLPLEPEAVAENRVAGETSVLLSRARGAPSQYATYRFGVRQGPDAPWTYLDYTHVFVTRFDSRGDVTFHGGHGWIETAGGLVLDTTACGGFTAVDIATSFMPLRNVELRVRLRLVAGTTVDPETQKMPEHAVEIYLGYALSIVISDGCEPYVVKHGYDAARVADPVEGRDGAGAPAPPFDRWDDVSIRVNETDGVSRVDLSVGGSHAGAWLVDLGEKILGGAWRPGLRAWRCRVEAERLEVHVL